MWKDSHVLPTFLKRNSFHERISKDQRPRFVTTELQWITFDLKRISFQHEFFWLIHTFRHILLSQSPRRKIYHCKCSEPSRYLKVKKRECACFFVVKSKRNSFRSLLSKQVWHIHVFISAGRIQKWNLLLPVNNIRNIFMINGWYSMSFFLFHLSLLCKY